MRERERDHKKGTSAKEKAKVGACGPGERKNAFQTAQKRGGQKVTKLYSLGE